MSSVQPEYQHQLHTRHFLQHLPELILHLLFESFDAKLKKIELKALIGGSVDITMGQDPTNGPNGTTQSDTWRDQI